MELIIGGHSQGQAEYAVSCGLCTYEDMISGENCGFDDIFSCTAVDKFHEYVRRFAKRIDAKEFTDRIICQCPDIVIITDEIGCGIVPIDKYERYYRELHGRICCMLAAQADSVVRVICGIGNRIK